MRSDMKFFEDQWLSIFQGDCREVMASLPEKSVHCVVTSPPYYSLRDYGLPPSMWGADAACEHEWGNLMPPRPGGRGNKPGEYSTSSLTNPWRQDEAPRATSSGQYCAKCGGWLGQLGLEPTPEEYVDHLVEVFQQVHRVLRDDGTFWLNLGDSYNAGRNGGHPGGKDSGFQQVDERYVNRSGANVPGLGPKQLIGIPWRAAFALQANGWILRSDIIWSKDNPMPSSVQDRPTTSHEYVFMFAKQVDYFYDIDATRVPHTAITMNRIKYGLKHTHPDGIGVGIPPVDTDEMGERFAHPGGRNARTVWNISTQPYKGAHYAVFPKALVEPMVKAGTSERGVCSNCGAPWRRVVEVESSWEARKEAGATRGNMAPEGNVGAGTQRGIHGAGVSHDLDAVSRKTVGWERTCEHVDAATVPATVLDPFAGSGTVGLVAQEHSRRALLVDLNGEYLSQQMARNAQVPLGLGSTE